MRAAETLFGMLHGCTAAIPGKKDSNRELMLDRESYSSLPTLPVDDARVDAERPHDVAEERRITPLAWLSP